MSQIELMKKAAATGGGGDSCYDRVMVDQSQCREQPGSIMILLSAEACD